MNGQAIGALAVAGGAALPAHAAGPDPGAVSAVRLARIGGEARVPLTAPDPRQILATRP
jgi:hypothetical protein